MPWGGSASLLETVETGQARSREEKRGGDWKRGEGRNREGGTFPSEMWKNFFPLVLFFGGGLGRHTQQYSEITSSSAHRQSQG